MEEADGLEREDKHFLSSKLLDNSGTESNTLSTHNHRGNIHRQGERGVRKDGQSPSSKHINSTRDNKNSAQSTPKTSNKRQDPNIQEVDPKDFGSTSRNLARQSTNPDVWNDEVKSFDDDFEAYIDHASDTVDIFDLEKAKHNPKFPQVLHQLLSSLELQGMSHIAGFQPHGRAFAVKDNRIFTGQIMPNWFKQSKLTSFQRQLNLYGFRRVTRGQDAGAYWHPLFLRGREALTVNMHRIKGKRQSGNPTPNFWDFPPLTKRGNEENLRQEVAQAVLQPMTTGAFTTSRRTKRLYNQPDAYIGLQQPPLYQSVGAYAMTGTSIMTSPLVRRRSGKRFRSKTS